MIANRVIGGNGGETASIFVTGLHETDTVTAAKDGKSYSGKWVSRPNPAYVVPDGYTQLDYIESTGTQYIDTGITPKPNQAIDLYMKVSTGNHGAWLFGSDDNSTKRFGIDIDNNTQIAAIFCADSWTSRATLQLDTVVNIKYTLGITQEFKINGNSVGTKTNSIVNDASLSYYIFGVNRNNTFTGISKIKLYNFKVYSDIEETSLIRNFIPCKRSSDNAIGMYDLVTNTFYGNSGTGTFVAGAEVPQTIDGFVIDNIKSYGTYTITATDGTNTATQDVLVDMATQYEVAMTYFNGLKLYWYGDECEDVTGGWGLNGYTWELTPSSGTKESDNLYLPTGTSYDSCRILGTNIKINFEPYSKLKLDLVTSGTESFGDVDIGISESKNSSPSAYIKRSAFYEPERTVVEIDVSDINSLYYLSCKSFRNDGRWARIYRIWLE